MQLSAELASGTFWLQPIDLIIVCIQSDIENSNQFVL